MKLSFRKRKGKAVSVFLTYFDERRGWKRSSNPLEILTHIVEKLRPTSLKETVSLSEIITLFIERPEIKNEFRRYLRKLVGYKNFESIISDAGILQDTDFIYEVKKRIGAKFLPYQPPKDTLQYVFNQVFYSETDPIWLSQLSEKEVETLFELLDFATIYDSVEINTPLFEIFQALRLLSQRASGRALETNVIKMVPEYANLENPFTTFEYQLSKIEKLIFIGSASHSVSSRNEVYQDLIRLLDNCFAFVDKAFENSAKYGISLRVNQDLLRIRQQLQRIQTILPILVVDESVDKKRNTIKLFLQLITLNCKKNNVRKLIDESTQLISYEITQHTAKTGEHYITHTKKEYFQMLKAAVGGGFIVGILCIVKLLFSKVLTSDFGYAFLYSLNYSLGFIIIYILGFTLATKQPAMTAASLVKALEEGTLNTNDASGDKHQAFAVLFARLFRSQFIAFVGNVFTAFPVTLLGVWLIDLVFHVNIAETKWTKLITDLSPVDSLAIFHAAIAGIFLFLSGIISGSIANRDKFYEVYYRIQEHPWLKLRLGKRFTKQLSKWYEKNWAAIVSNFWFGIFLGSTASIGIFLGLNLDIRHITFASGNLALALHGAHYSIGLESLLWGIFGIGIIGLVNFLVSFSLSLGLAFRSRNTPIKELNLIFVSIKNHFRNKPLSFFFPVEK